MSKGFIGNVLGNGRGVGVTELLHGPGDWPAVVLFALVTQLGDVWLLFLLGGVLYVAGDELPRWGIDRRRGLFVVALALTYVALIGVLKTVFALPRPPGAGDPPVAAWIPPVAEGVFVDITTADGPGFPSGHALGSTMVWGGVALVVDRGAFRTRAAVVAALVALISLSRLVLGVHYFVDVLVGAAVGVVVLVALYLATERGTDPWRAFVVAAAIGVAQLLTAVTFDSVAAIGGSVGGLLAWRGVADSTPAHPSNRREVVAGFLVFLLAGAVFVVVHALKPSYPLTFVATALAVAAVVVAPITGERLV